LPDLLNQIALQGLHSALFVLNYYRQQIHFINEQMRHIKKIQRICDLLYKCKTLDLSVLYRGIIIDIEQKIVYLLDLKSIVTFYNSEPIENQTIYYFKLYLFEDDATLRRKIRAEITHQNKIS
jgi:hypothetical protein